MHSAMDCHVASATKTIFGKCADTTDEKKLKDLLEVDERQKLRVKIRKLKEAHVHFLQGKYDKDTPKTLSTSTPPCSIISVARDMPT